MIDMNRPSKPMRLTYENVRFQKIKHTSDFNMGYEYISDFRFDVHTFVSMGDHKGSIEFEDVIQQKQIHFLDDMVYGQYRRYLKDQLFIFLREMDKYKRVYKGMNDSFTEYVIPEGDITKLQTDIFQLINEIE